MHKRSANGRKRHYEKREAKRNLYASLMENCFGTEAGRTVTTLWAESPNGLIPVCMVDQALLKPERVHGGILRMEVSLNRKGEAYIHGDVPDDAITTKFNNKRAAVLSKNFKRR